MWILGKHVSTLTEGNLAELVQGGVIESQTLDYKSVFAVSSDEEKKSLLADVTAMANTSGGIIFFGADTSRGPNGKDTGVPTAFPGLAGINFDTERLTIQNILRSAASPSLTTQVFVKDIVLASGNTVIALGIARSYLAPHRVAFKETNRFYRRGQGGNYQPEVAELRRMFLEQHDWTAEGLQFAKERSDEIANFLETQPAAPVLVIHLLPLGRLDPTLDVRGRREEIGKIFQPLISSTGYSWDYNLEGIRIFSPSRPQATQTYCQVFRSGAVEFGSLGFGAESESGGTPQRIWGSQLMQTVRTRLPEAVKQMRATLKVEPPYLISIRLLAESSGGEFWSRILRSTRGERLARSMPLRSYCPRYWSMIPTLSARTK